MKIVYQWYGSSFDEDLMLKRFIEQKNANPEVFVFEETTDTEIFMVLEVEEKGATMLQLVHGSQVKEFSQEECNHWKYLGKLDNSRLGSCGNINSLIA